LPLFSLDRYRLLHRMRQELPTVCVASGEIPYTKIEYTAAA